MTDTNLIDDAPYWLPAIGTNIPATRRAAHDWHQELVFVRNALINGEVTLLVQVHAGTKTARRAMVFAARARTDRAPRIHNLGPALIELGWASRVRSSGLETAVSLSGGGVNTVQQVVDLALAMLKLDAEHGISVSPPIVTT